MPCRFWETVLIEGNLLHEVGFRQEWGGGGEGLHE